MRAWKALFSLTLLSIPVGGYTTCNTTAVWQGPGNTWSTATNWSPNCVPDGAIDGASFNGNSPTAVTQDVGAISLLQLLFSNQNYNITGPSANTITFTHDPSFIAITPPSSPHATTATIGVPLIIDSPSVSINLNSGTGALGTLNITGDVTITPGSLLQRLDQGNRSIVNFNGNLTINQGTLTNLNSFAFTSVVGNTMNVNTATLNLGAGSTLKNINTGTISTAPGTGATILFNNLLTISGGDMLNMNSGSIINGAAGSQLIVPSLNITAGTLTNSNSGIVSDATSFGSLIFSQGNINISGSGVVNNLNTGSQDAQSFGSIIRAMTPASINISGPSGVLLNNDQVQADTINVNSGGTLSGIGTFSSVYNPPSPPAPTAVTNSGTVEPFSGTSPGTMTIVGTYTQTPSGTFLVDLSSPSSFSQLNVIGTAQLAGTLEVDLLPDNRVNPGDTYTILNALSSTGTFSVQEFINLPSSMIGLVQYTPTSVILSFLPSGGGEGLSPTYAGGFLQTLLSDINHINSHLGLRMEELRRHFGSALAAASPLAKAGRLDLSEWFPPARPQQINSNLVASLEKSIFPNDNFVGMNPQTEEKQEQLRREVAQAPSERFGDRPWNLYFGPTGRAGGDLHTRLDQPGLNYWSAGLLAGFDYAFSQIGVGFLADYERITAHAKQDWGKITIDEFHASLYSTYAPASLPELAFNGIVGGAYELYYIRRNTGTPTEKRVAIGTPHGSAFDALFGVEYALGNRLQVIPLANVQYIYLRSQSYEENRAGPFDVGVSSQKVKSLRSSFGLRLNYVWEKPNFTFTPEIYGEWQREYLNKRRHIHFSAMDFPGDNFSLVMPGSGRNIALAGADLLFTLYKRFGIEGSYEFEYNSLYHDHFFYLGANVRF